MSAPTTPPGEFVFDPSDDPLRRLQRLLRIAPREGVAPVRRALILAVIAWVPLAVWAALNSRMFPGRVDEPLLAHFGLNVRCLIALPALIVAEGMLALVMAGVLPYLVRAGIVQEQERGRLKEIIARTARLRDSLPVWIAIGALAFSGTLTSKLGADDPDRLRWAMEAQGMGFGGQWSVWVAEPLFHLLLLAWLWRLFLVFDLFSRISRLELRLQAMHPDGVGGLGPVRRVTAGLGPLVFALAAVIASSVAHNIRFHGGHVADFQALAAVAVVLLAALVTAPLLPFGGPLRKTKARGLLEYGALAGRHAGAVRARWVEGRPVEADEAMLSAPELGPVADVGSLFQQVARMRTALVGKETLLAALLPTVLPMLVVASLEVPVKELLKRLLGALL